MSRNRPMQNFVQAVNQPKDFSDMIRQQLESARIAIPAGREILNSKLGYPDFEIATGNSEEDQLTDKRLREGYCDPAAGLYAVGTSTTPLSERNDEHGSMEEKFGRHDFETLREKLKLPKRESNKRPRRVRHKCSLFPEPEHLGENTLMNWLKSLAACEEPLKDLAKQVPYVSGNSSYNPRAKELLNRMTELQVPLLRAVWFVKVTLLKQYMDATSQVPTEQVDRNMERKLTDAWTETMTSYMHDHFLKFAKSRGECETGIQVESLVKKWAYVVRFADWCYHEGILNRIIYMKWVIDEFQKSVKDPLTETSWSAELMLPLIVNIFPELCRLRTEIPELIRVCVNRYMRECVFLPGTPGFAVAYQQAQQAQQQQPTPQGSQNQQPQTTPQTAQQLPPSQPPQQMYGAPMQTGLPGPRGQNLQQLPQQSMNQPQNLNPSLLPGAAAAAAAAANAASTYGILMGGNPSNLLSATESTAKLLLNLKKLVKSLLLMSPEAFISLHPEIQTAWRLIESDAIKFPRSDGNLFDFNGLKLALRKDPFTSTPTSWLSVAMPWVEHERKMKSLWDDLGPGKVLGDLIDSLDKCCAGRSACDMTRLRETWIKPAMNSTWQVVFEEHRKARTFVKIVCGWAVSRYREHVPEAVYVAASFLKGLDQNLSEFFKIDIKDNDSQSGTQSNSPDGQNESASSPMQMDTTDENEYSLHAYIEEFLESFEPESGYEEPEMDTLERLIGELIRNRVFDHNMWIFGLIARGAFQKNNSSSPENKFRKHHRLLANIPSYPEARHDSCQRRILLRSIGVMDMGPCSLFYALKIVRFLSWSASDLDQKRLKTTPGTEILESFTNAAAELKAIGRFDPSRINAIEWEESVNFVWLQHERHHDYSDAFTDGILSSRGLSILFSSLYKIMLEVPLYVRVQLCRHIASVIQYIADRTRSVEFELIEPSDIPEDLKLTDEVLYRAITLLECAGDLKCLIALLEWLIENFPSALAAMTMFSHLRTIRALDIASRVFDLSLTALLKTEASNKQNAAMGISELLSAMIRHGSESDLKSFEEKMTAKTTGLKSPLGPKASAVSQLLQDALENKPTKRPDVHANVDDVELKESIKAAEQRPELSDLVGRIFSGGHTIQEVAEQIKKHVAEANISHSVLVAAILRCAVNGTLKEIRSNYRFGCTGFALSSMLSLLAALEHHYGKMHLARIALNIVMDRMYETAVVPAASEDTSPSTVDTPQPQTPLTPATPDSLPNPKSRVGDDADLTLRQDATLAFVGGLLAKGLLIWEDIEKQVKAKLEDVVNGKHPHLARLLLNFVEMLLTDKRKGAAAMMIRIDWQKLRVLRQTQPTLSDVYIMLKYLVQIIDQRDWKQPALTCMQQVVHDPGFCRIILCDDPRSFLKDCCKACMLTLRTAPDVISPFRYFTFLPGNGSRDGPLAAVQDVIARVGRWSLHYDCIELRILVDAWKGGLADLTENMPEPNGWKAMASHPAVDQDKVNNFQSQLSDDKLNELNEAFLRNQDQIIEHHVVEMLLAQLWRSPRNVSRVLDFAKAMGQSFQDRELMGSGGWFEEKMVSIVLAVMSCEPIAKANMGIDSFFRDFIHPSSLNADRGSKIVDDNEHTASFELALVHVIERYGILLPNIQQDRDGASVQLLSLRKDCISKLISLINTLVDQANSGEFRNDYPLEAQGAESASSSQPNVGSLQRALILRLQMLSASLVYLPDEDPQNKSRETLKSVIDCIKFVFSCKTLLGYELGDGVYRTAMLILDRAGSGRDSLLTQRDSRGVVKTMGQWFRSEAQKELLRMKFPRLVASNLSLELPVGGVSLTNGGFVRQAPHDWNYAEETGVFGTGLCSFDQLFELDPWLLLEDFPQGVLSRHLQQVKRRPRKRLRFEFASPEQIAAEKALAEKAAQEKEMAAAAAEEVVEEVGFDVGFVEPGTSMLSGPSNDWPGGWGGGGAVTDSIFTDLDLV